MQLLTGNRVATLLAILVALILITDLLFIAKNHARRKRCMVKNENFTSSSFNGSISSNGSQPIPYIAAHVARFPPWEKNMTVVEAKQVGSCTVHYGTSYIGGDFLSVVGIEGAGACCRVCEADPRCVVWTLEGTTCWMKDHFPGPYLTAPEARRGFYTSGFVNARRDRSMGCLQSVSTLELRTDKETTFINQICNHTTNSSYISRRVLIYGLTHGLSRSLANVFNEQIELFGRMFSDYRVIVYDNDNPCSPLVEMAKNNSRVRIMTEYLQMPPAQVIHEYARCGRVRMLAHLRNRLLSRVREWLLDPLEQSFDRFQPDLLIQMDFDQLLSGGLLPQIVGPAICSAMIQYRGWDVLCAYGQMSGKFYDTFAVRTCEVEYYEQFFNFSIVGASALSLKEAISPRRRPRMQLMPRMLRVRSCFSALSLMRPEVLLNSTCIYEEEPCMCEHVPFMACLSHQGYDNVFIDTSLVVDYRNNADRLGLQQKQLFQDCNDGWSLFEATPPPR